ncbi:hypothetical protein QBC38DRAFT_469992 [Podospora fimiseda]|uniref:Long chronological lifespan protein 2 n=1 Tax=Podospora fimiseda TaxID=252190 RepID=A0AAN7H3Y8_9PEZI|nr:hypothetical protein QBC38DRAFT_469992 [Podospora fimiseda]
MRAFSILLFALVSLTTSVSAQFGNFFEGMFGGGGHQQHGGHHGHGHQQQQQNVASDSGAYRASYNRAHCDKYLCPDTLACVHFPHHCPCPWPANEEKVELGEGMRICVSHGGFKAGEAARKIELARKGLL